MSHTPDHTLGAVMCADTTPSPRSVLAPRLSQPSPLPALVATAIFPPAGCDEDTRRAWLASSPWPEVVFASA